MWTSIKQWILSKFAGMFFEVAVTSIGMAAEQMKETAADIVSAIEEDEELDGQDKFNIAWDVLSDKFPDSPEEAKNLAIETAVAIVKEQM